MTTGTPPTATLAPFGEIRRDRFYWVGKTQFRFWAGCQTRVDSFNGEPASDGTVTIHIEPLADIPSPEQIQALQFVFENEQLVGTNILNAVLEIYPEQRRIFRQAYGYSSEMSEEEKDDFEEEYGFDVPEISNPEELKAIIKLHTIHIKSTARDGLAYMGYEFECNWDEEHGLGVMTHGSRVIEVEQAEVSFGCVAEEDGQVDLGTVYGEGLDLDDPDAEPTGKLVYRDPDL